ncbi:MAG TPA: peptidoglycan-binding domain-containing protein [Bacteroidia bacterium]|nr:peptidoglycan-binding domain-containing protein [Bacteroidia bacterium]
MGKKQITQQTQSQTQEGPVQDPVVEMLKEGAMREIFAPEVSPVLFAHILGEARERLFEEEVAELELLIEELKIALLNTEGAGDEYSTSNDNSSIVITKAPDPGSADYQQAYNHVSININVCDRPVQLSWYFLLMPSGEADKTLEDTSSETQPTAISLEQFLSWFPDPLTDDHNLQSPVLSGMPVLESVYDGRFPTGEGGNGDYVKRLQLALLLMNPQALPKYGIDGYYGSETTDAVYNYQENSGSMLFTNDESGNRVIKRKNQLTPDGIVGKQTVARLDADMTRIYKELKVDNAFNEEKMLERLYAYYKAKNQTPPPHETMRVMAQMLLEIRKTENAKAKQPEAQGSTTQVTTGTTLDENQTATLLMGGLTAEQIDAMTDDELKVWIWEHFKLERPDELNVLFTELRDFGKDRAINLAQKGVEKANEIWRANILLKLGALGFSLDGGKIVKTMVLHEGKWIYKTQMIASKFVQVQGLKNQLGKSTKLATFLQFLDWGKFVDPITFAQALYENDPFVFSPFHDAMEAQLAEIDATLWEASLRGTYSGFIHQMENKVKNGVEAEWGVPLKELRIVYLTTLEYINMLGNTFVMTKEILETPRLFPANVYINNQFVLDHNISYAIVLWGKGKDFYAEEIQENTPIGPATEIVPIGTFLMKTME